MSSRRYLLALAAGCASGTVLLGLLSCGGGGANTVGITAPDVIVGPASVGYCTEYYSLAENHVTIVATWSVNGGGTIGLLGGPEHVGTAEFQPSKVDGTFQITARRDGQIRGVLTIHEGSVLGNWQSISGDQISVS